MAGFLYFRPHETTPITRGQIAALGLGYAFPKGVAAGICQGDTPTQSIGCVFADPARQGARSVKMDRSTQTWRRLPKSDIWCGFWNDDPPRPADLARDPQLAGYTVKLAGGREWLVPLVRLYDPLQKTTRSRLPCAMECDDDGNWHRGPVVAQHAHLWDVTTPIAEAMLAQYAPREGAEPAAVDVADADIFAAIVALLQANYVVGPGELSLMGALTSEPNTHAAVMAACDWVNFLGWHESLSGGGDEKKSASPSAAPGSALSAGAAV